MIVVRRTYVPRPGAGGQLLAATRAASDAIAKAGFRRPRTLRTAFGDHGTLVTEQQWDSLAEYDASRRTVRNTPAIVEAFEKIYPLLETTHNTEILVEVD